MRNIKVLIAIQVIFFGAAIIFANVAHAFDRDGNTIGKTPRFSLHLTSPFALATKGGLKLEGVTPSGWAVLGSYTRYWGIFPGNQFGLEGRKYFINEKGNRTNLFLYGRMLAGNADVNKYYTPFWEQQPTIRDIEIGGSYMGAGAGGGCRMNYGMFFFEFSFGFKAVGGDGPSSMDIGDSETFYLSGPGAVVDLHLNLGFQLDG